MYSTEAVYRYYESRRRIWNDSKPSRQAKVAQNKHKSSRRAMQLQVLH